MTVTKLRKAMKRTYNCCKCNSLIEVGMSYYDSDEKVGKKPFPTNKYCQTCIDKNTKK